ncbi:MAG: cytochrome c3 family protein [Burkholderiales bacterium]
MKSRLALFVIALNLVVLVSLAFIYPALMVSPGQLSKAHAELASDCFSCHTPFLGASSARCESCHKVSQIGLLTTKGAPRPQAGTKIAFHQKLARLECIECHTDHAGLRPIDSKQKAFSHRLLSAEVQKQCASCHTPPKDSLHAALTDSCAQCHSQSKWKPATFDHNKLFVLDKDHNVKCTTCHENGDYKRYTCYGCHEHQPDKIRRKHIKEGIRDFENCVSCHKDPGEDPD